MTDVALCPTARKVLDILLQHAGMNCSAEDVCELVDCTTTHTRRVLDMLADDGLIERWECGRGTVTYVARR